MSTKYQGEPMQISWNLCLIQTKFIKIEIQEDSMCFVVTQFWTPHAEDGVYLFWIECRSLAHIHQKIDKGT